MDTGADRSLKGRKLVGHDIRAKDVVSSVEYLHMALKAM